MEKPSWGLLLVNIVVYIVYRSLCEEKSPDNLKFGRYLQEFMFNVYDCASAMKIWLWWLDDFMQRKPRECQFYATLSSVESNRAAYFFFAHQENVLRTL